MNKMTTLFVKTLTIAAFLTATAPFTLADQCTGSDDCPAGEVCVYEEDQYGNGENICKSTDDIFGHEEESCSESGWFCDGYGYLYYVMRWQTGTGCREDWQPSGGC